MSDKNKSNDKLNVVTIRISDEFMAMVKRRAKAWDCNLSDYFRNAAMFEALTAFDIGAFKMSVKNLSSVLSDKLKEMTEKASKSDPEMSLHS